MTPRRRLRRGLTALALSAATVSLLVACSSDDDKPSSEKSPSATPTKAAAPPAAPAKGACYALPFEDAVAPTSSAKPAECSAKHTSETVQVGTINADADGHLLAVDSEQVQAQVASACPAFLNKYVGGDLKQLRLSMIRPIWFTPTVEESDLGADWFRCDAVVVAGNEELIELTTSLKGALDRPKQRDKFAMCGTSAPDAKDFELVVCSAKHSWRAIDVVKFKDGNYPGLKTVRAAGRNQCENAAADIADDPLAFEWGYEWPTKEKWDAGQRFGRCWAED